MVLKNFNFMPRCTAQLIFLGLFIYSFSAIGQKVFEVQFPNQADVKVFEVKFMNQADLKVYQVNFVNQVNGCNGNWFTVDFPNQADFKIMYTDFPNQADLKIIFVKFPNQAGWINEDKKNRLCN